jgi:transmembrane sensor
MSVYGSMTGRTNEHESLLERAAEWHARLRADDAGVADHGAFAAWLAADARHRLAYADVCAAAYALESARGVSLEAPPLRAPAPVRRRGAWTGVFAGSLTAMLAAAALMLGASPWQNLASDAYTAAGVQREIALPDGSHVLLDGDSAIDIAYTDGERSIELVRGAAFFDVAKDAARPFVVHADGTRARAVGTRYAVERLGARVEVHVEEGIVEVASAAAPGAVRRVVAGQGVSVDAASAAPGDVHADDSAALAWTGGRLVFSATPLADAIARLDRQLPGRIVVLATLPADARVTAAFPARDAEGGLEAVAREHGLTLRRMPGFGYVVR